MVQYEYISIYVRERDIYIESDRESADMNERERESS